MQRAYRVVDTFAYEPYTGNSAAVVLDARGLADADMRRIAAEFNLSETTFVLPGPSGGARDWRFRWFTPAVEVDMCGHATVGGVYALIDAGIIGASGAGTFEPISIHTRGGVLKAFVEPLPSDPRRYMVWLEMLRPVLTPVPAGVLDLAELLGAESGVIDDSLSPVQTQDRDLIVFLRDVAVLNAVAPDMGRLESYLRKRGLRGLCLSTLRTISSSYHVQSRFFAPAVGILEDPVTGSVHGPLAAYLTEQRLLPCDGEVSAATCGQGIPGGRGGLLHALVTRQSGGMMSVRIGGRAFITMRGELEI